MTAKEELSKYNKEASSKGLLSQADLSNAQADLAEAHVRLLERKEAVLPRRGRRDCAISDRVAEHSGQCRGGRGER